jgi:hypothetical protein
MQNNEEFISIKQLANQLGMDRSHARRYVLKLGFNPKKRRTADSGSQLTLTLSKDEAETVIRNRIDTGFSSAAKAVEEYAGHFYVIQLVPELDPNRLKLGFAIDLNDRLIQHRTAAPTARIAKSWPCKRSWEITVMDCLAAANCRHILNEVFECNNLAELIEKGEQLFRILPNPKAKIEVSDHSPFKNKGGLKITE